MTEPVLIHTEYQVSYDRCYLCLKVQSDNRWGLIASFDDDVFLGNTYDCQWLWNSSSMKWDPLDTVMSCDDEEEWLKFYCLSLETWKGGELQKAIDHLNQGLKENE